MENFNKIHNRKGTRSIKWDLVESIFKHDNLLPMWVADMDFQSPKAINDAVLNRANHGIYGYTTIDEEVKSSVKSWLLRHHDWTIETEDLSFSPSVITSLHMAIGAFTEAGDKILIQTPVYTPFFNVIEEHDREILSNELFFNKQTGKYEIDFEDLEEKISSGVKAIILCSPHNPVGRVWTKNELTKIASLCKKYDALIISDEIHADLVYEPNKHIPIGSLSEETANRTITFMSPSKTFNMAGLHSSYSVISNKALRNQFNTQLKKAGLNGLNTIGIYALEAAYKHGDEWLDQLIKVLEVNKNYVINEFKEHAPDIKVIDAEGTYLLWLDCSLLGMDENQLEEFFLKEAGVALNKGIGYGDAGKQFMRINIACPKSLLEKGIQQILSALKKIN